jgi:predicted RNA-binding protein YlxR (DUF448 family)
MVTPERTCIGCRTRRDQAGLVRFRLDGTRVVPAQPGAPGRSAYLCPDERCLDAAEKRRAFPRAFRGQVTLDPAVRRVLTAGAAATGDPAATRRACDSSSRKAVR